jgi:hypothetical protein
MRRIAWIALIAGFALIAVGAAMAIGRGSGTERVSATFEARAIGNPNIKLCRRLGDGYLQFEGTYAGVLRTAGGETFNITLRGFQVLASRETGLGAVEGTWQLQAPPVPDVVGRGELTAVFVGDPHIIGDPNVIGDPHIFAGEAHGMMIGGIEDPDERTALWNVAITLSSGETQTGAIGDPGIAPNPAILIPSGRC